MTRDELLNRIKQAARDQETVLDLSGTESRSCRRRLDSSQ